MSRLAQGAGASRLALRDTIVNIRCSRIFLADGRENPTFTMVVGPGVVFSYKCEISLNARSTLVVFISRVLFGEVSFP